MRHSCSQTIHKAVLTLKSTRDTGSQASFLAPRSLPHQTRDSGSQTHSLAPYAFKATKDTGAQTSVKTREICTQSESVSSNQKLKLQVAKSSAVVEPSSLSTRYTQTTSSPETPICFSSSTQTIKRLVTSQQSQTEPFLYTQKREIYTQILLDDNYQEPRLKPVDNFIKPALTHPPTFNSFDLASAYVKREQEKNASAPFSILPKQTSVIPSDSSECEIEEIKSATSRSLQLTAETLKILYGSEKDDVKIDRSISRIHSATNRSLALTASTIKELYGSDTLSADLDTIKKQTSRSIAKTADTVKELYSPRVAKEKYQ